MTEPQKGNAYVIFSGIIWSLFPIVTILGLKGIPSMIGLFWAISFSALFFFLMIAIKRRWKELKNLQAWEYCFMIAVFNGVFYYGLFFLWLNKDIAS